MHSVCQSREMPRKRLGNGENDLISVVCQSLGLPVSQNVLSRLTGLCRELAAQRHHFFKTLALKVKHKLEPTVTSSRKHSRPARCASAGGE
jgi:hypothetical protein